VVTEEQKRKLVADVIAGVAATKALDPDRFTYEVTSGTAGNKFMVVVAITGMNGWRYGNGRDNTDRVVAAAVDTETGAMKAVTLLKSGAVRMPKKQPKCTIKNYEIGPYGVVKGTVKGPGGFKVMGFSEA
jgi:hypothetical protein